MKCDGDDDGLHVVIILYLEILLCAVLFLYFLVFLHVTRIKKMKKKKNSHFVDQPLMMMYKKMYNYYNL